MGCAVWIFSADTDKYLLLMAEMDNNVTFCIFKNKFRTCSWCTPEGKKVKLWQAKMDDLWFSIHSSNKIYCDELRFFHPLQKLAEHVLQGAICVVFFWI